MQPELPALPDRSCDTRDGAWLDLRLLAPRPWGQGGEKKKKIKHASSEGLARLCYKQGLQVLVTVLPTWAWGCCAGG